MNWTSVSSGSSSLLSLFSLEKHQHHQSHNREQSPHHLLEHICTFPSYRSCEPFTFRVPSPLDFLNFEFVFEFEFAAIAPWVPDVGINYSTDQQMAYLCTLHPLRNNPVNTFQFQHKFLLVVFFTRCGQHCRRTLQGRLLRWLTKVAVVSDNHYARVPITVAFHCNERS